MARPIQQPVGVRRMRPKSQRPLLGDAVVACAEALIRPKTRESRPGQVDQGERADLIGATFSRGVGLPMSHPGRRSSPPRPIDRRLTRVENKPHAVQDIVDTYAPE